MPANSPQLIQELFRFLSPDQVISPNGSHDTKPDLIKYGKDWTKHFSPNPGAILFPRSTEEVQRIVLACGQHRLAIVPSGGRSGLSGGAVALHGEVVVSFEKMNRVLEFDEWDPSVTVQSGMITEQVQKFAADKGLFYPVDFAARGSSQIGGNLATNAGGIKVLRYGLTRNWVTGMTVVTGAGHILHLNRGLIKNATGYDLRHLFIGSEGTLGLITEVTLSLTRPPLNPQLFLFGLKDLKSVMRVFKSFKSKLSLLAYEMFTEKALQVVLQHHSDLKRPFAEQTPYYGLVEFEGDGEALNIALKLFEEGMEAGWIADGSHAQTAAQYREFWRLREDISEATAPYSPYKNDVSVRISKVPEFLESVEALLKQSYPTWEVVWFGHVGDGNLHINILKPQDLTSEEFVKRCQTVDDSLYQTIERFGGSISAEHGVGLTKKAFLRYSRSLEEIELMRQLKKVFDPLGLLNPTKLF